jgi:hypothetical protein
MRSRRGFQWTRAEYTRKRGGLVFRIGSGLTSFVLQKALPRSPGVLNNSGRGRTRFHQSTGSVAQINRTPSGRSAPRHALRARRWYSARLRSLVLRRRESRKPLGKFLVKNRRDHAGLRAKQSRRKALRTPEFVPMYSRLTGNSASPCVASSPCGVCIVARGVFLSPAFIKIVCPVNIW